jgi:hypothetical protein
MITVGPNGVVIPSRLSEGSRRAFRSEARGPEFRLVAELAIAEPRGCLGDVDRGVRRLSVTLDQHPLTKDGGRIG